MKNIIMISFMIATLFNVDIVNSEHTFSNQNEIYNNISLQKIETCNSVLAQQNKNESRADIYEWRYKIVNGKMYKRLYNCTRNEWVGDWILMK